MQGEQSTLLGLSKHSHSRPRRHHRRSRSHHQCPSPHSRPPQLPPPLVQLNQLKTMPLSTDLLPVAPTPLKHAHQDRDIAKIYLNHQRMHSMHKGRNQPNPPKHKSPSKKKSSRGKGSKSKSKSPKKHKEKGNKHSGKSREAVLAQYSQVLTPEEITELQQQDYSTVYFLGLIPQRLARSHLGFSTPKCQPSSARDTLAERTDALREEPASPEQGQFYKYEIGDHVAYRYEILALINQGSFGEVLRVYDHRRGELQALKIVRRSGELLRQTYVEMKVLMHLQERDKAGMGGVVRVRDFAMFRGHVCIAFELLDGNLYELLSSNHSMALNDHTIRVFAMQLLNALLLLRREGVVHCDIKPENILMQRWGKSGLKLADFGTSCFEGQQLYTYLQSRYYRSPEIILRQPYSFPIDMWSLACVLVELKTGDPLFPASQDVEQLLYFMSAIGLPRAEEGSYSEEYLRTEEFEILLSQDFLGQYERLRGDWESLNSHPIFKRCRNIEMGMGRLADRMPRESRSDELFADFIGRILCWEPGRRMTPEQALEHPWIVSGLSQEMSQLYKAINRLGKPTSKGKGKPKSRSKQRSRDRSPPFYKDQPRSRKLSKESKKNKSKSKSKGKSQSKSLGKRRSKSQSKDLRKAASRTEHRSPKGKKQGRDQGRPGEFMRGFYVGRRGGGSMDLGRRRKSGFPQGPLPVPFHY